MDIINLHLLPQITDVDNITFITVYTQQIDLQDFILKDGVIGYKDKQYYFKYYTAHTYLVYEHNISPTPLFYFFYSPVMHDPRLPGVPGYTRDSLQ